VILVKAGAVDRAIFDFTNVIHNDFGKSKANAYYARGRAYFEKREYEKAVADYGSAIELRPTFASAFYHRSLAYAALGKHALAQEDVAASRIAASGDGHS